MPRHKQFREPPRYSIPDGTLRICCIDITTRGVRPFLIDNQITVCSIVDSIFKNEQMIEYLQMVSGRKSIQEAFYAFSFYLCKYYCRKPSDFNPLAYAAELAYRKYFDIIDPLPTKKKPKPKEDMENVI